MVLPRWLAMFNKRVTNRLASAVSGSVSPISTIVHVGRKTGKEYRTPVTVFERGGTYCIALTYGTSADWVQNVLAAGECWLEHKRALVHLTEFDVVDRHLVSPDLPDVVQAALGVLDANDLLVGRE